VNPFSLDGKRALIAGASRGIGLAIARAVAEAGADTILASRNLEALEAEAAALRGQGRNASALALDIADEASVAAAADRAGDVDILINVAGTNIRKHFATYTAEEYQRIMQTNLHGIVSLTQKIGAKMVARGKGGKIVHIGSYSSQRGMPYITVYAMTKSALDGLTRTLAAEWGRHNIQVNCIAPGFILTDLIRKMWEDETMLAWMRGGQAIPRLGTPEDVAATAVFLASPASDYITGQVIAVDGGRSTTSVWPFEPK
jgi:NAD(P)-dependent dehydrogenase (short-subunit alcohol dehydrogenase family)